jgi:arylsulfatase A-like enzyme
MILAAWVSGSPTQPNAASRNQPNIVIIALDTARADHLSAYGYPKPTTPHLDALAKRGVLFEKAIANSSWTLPSFAAVLTGLLPHQNATALQTPLGKGFLTVAAVLRCRGYQTAGFNANASYGTARAGLAQGFDVYDDDDGTLRSNLINIEIVKAFWAVVYFPLIRPQALPRRNARTLNQAVLRWFRHRSRRPLFLLVNYVDVHEPYIMIPEVGARFGPAQTTLSQRIRAEVDQITWGIAPPQSAEEQAELIAGYDSALAFTDSQIGNLIQDLESSPEWSNTYIIVFGDHGQAFGTHQHYGHGWGLNGELLHVPLIIAGPGIPQGRRVRDLVGLQQLFATVLDLSAPQTAAPVANSLRCSWMLPPGTRGGSPAVISEFVGHDEFSISILTPERHLIRDAAGKLQLYDLIADPNEQVNLAGAPEHQAEIAALQSRLLERIRATTAPWLGEEYLWALGERNYSQLARERRVRAPWPFVNTQRPSISDKELLQSLPYQ